MREPAGRWVWGRFALGLAGIFLGTVGLTLAAIAAGAALVPSWGSTVVASGSMEPALRRGDVVVYIEQEIHQIKRADIVIFDVGRGSTVHRVDSINDDGSATTRGDANRSTDSVPVQTGMLHGRAFAIVPWVGMPTLWAAEGAYVNLALLVVTSIVLLQTATLAWRPENDPWLVSARRSGLIGSWLEHTTPAVQTSLLAPTRRSFLLERARSCS